MGLVRHSKEVHPYPCPSFHLCIACHLGVGIARMHERDRACRLVRSIESIELPHSMDCTFTECGPFPDDMRTSPRPSRSLVWEGNSRTSSIDRGGRFSGTVPDSNRILDFPPGMSIRLVQGLLRRRVLRCPVLIHPRSPGTLSFPVPVEDGIAPVLSRSSTLLPPSHVFTHHAPIGVLDRSPHVILHRDSPTPQSTGRRSGSVGCHHVTRPCLCASIEAPPPPAAKHPTSIKASNGQVIQGKDPVHHRRFRSCKVQDEGTAHHLCCAKPSTHRRKSNSVRRETEPR